MHLAVAFSPRNLERMEVWFSKDPSLLLLGSAPLLAPKVAQHCQLLDYMIKLLSSMEPTRVKLGPTLDSFQITVKMDLAVGKNHWLEVLITDINR